MGQCVLAALSHKLRRATRATTNQIAAGRRMSYISIFRGSYLEISISLLALARIVNSMYSLFCCTKKFTI